MGGRDRADAGFAEELGRPCLDARLELLFERVFFLVEGKDAPGEGAKRERDAGARLVGPAGAKSGAGTQQPRASQAGEARPQLFRAGDEAAPSLGSWPPFAS